MSHSLSQSLNLLCLTILTKYSPNFLYEKLITLGTYNAQKKLFFFFFIVQENPNTKIGKKIKVSCILPFSSAAVPIIWSCSIFGWFSEQSGRPVAADQISQLLSWLFSHDLGLHNSNRITAIFSIKKSTLIQELLFLRFCLFFLLLVVVIVVLFPNWIRK